MSSPSPPRRRAAVSTNVRESPSSFVGRAGDLSAIKARFDEGARLVTVLSPGGMGKTRAATRFARLHGEGFAAHGGGGAWFCDLTDAGGVDALCGVVAAELGVPLERSADERAIIADVGRAIARKKRVLLVLDNLEHLAREAARVVRAWMILAPDARFLATSRAVLGVPGEHLVHLEPLSLPRPGQSAAEIMATESVDLFVRRAREVRPGFDPSAGEIEVLADVVRATDGIPLAIELAAARVAVLTLEQIERRLATPLDLLVRRDDTGKHASMRRVIVDSFAQLDEVMRRRLAASSVFRGGFTLEAAESVLDGPQKGVLATLDALVARSLVRAREAPGELRFSCFEAIRELAAEELAALPGARAEVAARHARYYAAFGAALAGEAATAGGGALRARLGRELDNLIAAHAQAIEEAARAPEGEGAALALSLALALAPVLLERGRLVLGLRVLDEALAAASAAGSGSRLPGFAEALVARGNTRRELGDLDRARQDIAAGLALAQRSGDVALEAQACMRWGVIVEASGETQEARAHFVRGLARLAVAKADRLQRAREAEIRARLGHAHRREGDLDAAERETRRALALYREAGCDDELPTALYEAAVIALFRRRYAEAHAHFDEALALARAGGLKQAEGALSSALGILVQEEGRIDEALGHHAHAVRLFREIGSRIREASALYYLGGAFLERGSAGEASKLLAQAFDVVRGAGMPRYEVLIAGCLAVATASAGERDGAQAWLDKARAAASACASELSLQATLGIHEAHVALHGAPGIARRALVDRARDLTADWANDDVRFAWRLLLARTREDARPPATALAIFEEGARFVAPGAPSAVDLSRRAPLRRILFALATLRVEAPGEPLSMDEVVRAGWPGERIGSEAAANRVRVALATLRKLGLRRAIVTGQGGYLIDPATAVVIGSSLGEG